MTLRLVFPLLVLGLMCDANAARGDHNERLLQLLAGIDTVPSAQVLQQAVLQPEVALFAVSMDGELSLYERRRAVSLMSQFRSSSAELFLRAVALSVSAETVRELAIYTYIRSYGTRAPQQALAFAEWALKRSGPGDRRAAARGLRWVQEPRVRGLMDEAMVQEQDLSVRRVLQRSMDAHEQARRAKQPGQN
jgi:hypothetical protein